MDSNLTGVYLVVESHTDEGRVDIDGNPIFTTRELAETALRDYVRELNALDDFFHYAETTDEDGNLAFEADRHNAISIVEVPLNTISYEYIEGWRRAEASARR